MGGQEDAGDSPLVLGQSLINLLEKLNHLAIAMIGGSIPEDHELLLGIVP